jgi:hypothetical protein
MALRTGRKALLPRRIGLVLVSLALTLLGLELLFRIVGVKGEFHQTRVDVALPGPGSPDRILPYGFVPFATIRSQYDSDPRGYFEQGNSISHRFNSAGWRDVEHTVQKPAGTFRILGLGDSYLFGQGVKQEDVCLSKLGNLVNEAGRPYRVETINAGLSDMNTAVQSELLVHRGLAYNPNLVIVHFVLNDVEEVEALFRPGPKVEFFVDYVQIYQSPDWLSRRSYFWGWARQSYLRSVRAKRYIDQCIESFQTDSSKWDRCRRALLDIRDLTDERGIGLLFVIFPFFHDLDGDYPFQIIHDTVRSFCEQEGIHVLDLRDAYREYHGPELWVHPTDQHPNEIAHEIAARAIAAHLLNEPALLPMNLSSTNPASEP